MISRPFVSLWHHIRYLPLWSALTVSRRSTFEARSRSLGKFCAFLIARFPIASRRMDAEIAFAFENMPKAERRAIAARMGRKMGQTLFEIYHCREFQTIEPEISVSGPGLDALRRAHAAGQGAIIVSGHFGQWEAIRAVMRKNGMETGAVYRPQTNRHYERRLLSGIKAGGEPIIATGKIGSRELISHLRKGRIIAILLDEKTVDGEILPFLGKDARTSLSPAKLALRYGLPMVPAFGIRNEDGHSFSVDFLDPIDHSDPVQMTRDFNDIISQRILEHPDQWYWLLKRWKGVDRTS